MQEGMKSTRTGRPAWYISYTHDGVQYARKLAEVLQARGIEVLGFDAPKGSDSWMGAIRRTLLRSDAIILVGTAMAFQSLPVVREMDIGASARKAILPIVFRDVDVEDIPHFVAYGQWVYEQYDALRSGPSPQVIDALFDIARERGALTPSRGDEPLAIPHESRPLNEAKVILVGRGEVGKTSLVRRLVSNTFSGDESKTQGINITNWPLTSGKTTYRLNIWDFGGQEIMHATHQFFLTERSLYLLVLNGREGGEDIDAEYWLKHIESFGADSPVIVVQNKVGEHAFELNYRGLQGRYPQIRGFVKTDCRAKLGIDDLRSAIEKAIKDMPDVRMQFPADWFAVKERLESMDDEFMSFERFRELCAEQGVADDTDRDTLSSVLHCLGIALNYRSDSRLRETSILKPEWVTQGIYKILNTPKLAERQGELHLADLPQILPKKRYPADKHFFLLELMRKFSLCFAFPDDADHYLIPELLGKEEPEETRDFAPEDCLNFEYHYGVLPEGLIPRFIVRSHTLSRGQARWRSGVILAHEDCKALVTAVPADRRVIVRVKNGDAAARRRLLALVRYDLDRINAEFKDRLDAQPKMPLMQYPAFAVDYNKLAAFEKQGVEEFPEFVGQHVVKVRVKELLNGVDLQDQRQVSLATLAQAKSIFFSYSHKDEPLRDELETHLKLLQRLGVISVWHDRKILPGTEWDGEIDFRLDRAKIILLLVSASFIASDYCWGTEVKRAMERHEAGEATVIPIMLQPCEWKGSPFAKLQGLPKNMKPVTGFRNRDKAWTEVAKGIRAVAEG